MSKLRVIKYKTECPICGKKTYYDEELPPGWYNVRVLYLLNEMTEFIIIEPCKPGCEP